MSALDEKRQRNNAIKQAIDGQVYIKNNGIVEFKNIEDLKINIQGVEMNFIDYFKGIGEYKMNMQMEVRDLKATIAGLEDKINKIVERAEAIELAQLRQIL